jgi:hypothetical protein
MSFQAWLAEQTHCVDKDDVTKDEMTEPQLFKMT